MPYFNPFPLRTLSKEYISFIGQSVTGNGAKKYECTKSSLENPLKINKVFYGSFSKKNLNLSANNIVLEFIIPLKLGSISLKGVNVNRVPEASEVSPFIGRYQSKYQNCIPAIQVALVVIIATGIILALLSHYEYLQPEFVYVGAGASTLSSVVVISILCTRKNHLSLALANVSTIEELEQILETTKASSWDFSLHGLGTGCTRSSGADITFMISSSSIHGGVDDSQLGDFMHKLLNLETNNGTRPIPEDKKVIFERVYKLANDRCSAYTMWSNHFSIPDSYLNI